MDEYEVGKIADLISQNRVVKVKQNKKKGKTNEQKSSVSELSERNADKLILEKEKSKQKNRHSLKENQKINNTINTTIEIKKNTLSGKKRKNSESEISESRNILRKKKKIFNETEIDLNFVPSDSEEDDDKVGKTSIAKPQISNQKRKYTDFTECTVFVGNIPINYDKQKIHKMFSKFGKIKSARIRCVPIAEINMPKKVAAIKKQFNSKRNSLVAYVKYETQDSANAALAANGTVVDGHHLRVDLAERSKENDNKKAVFVGGLPFDIEDDELWEFFQNCGKIKSVRVVRDSQTLMGKGFGYVNFDSTAAVELALQMNGQELRKRTINVKRCVKARNKNKMNAFGRKKSKEVINQLLCKKGKKFKEEKKEKQNKKQQFLGNFQGKKASRKEKKKKKLSKADLRKRKLVKILGASRSQ